MNILFLSEDNSIFNNGSLNQVKISEYASLVNMLFVIVTTGFKKKSIQTKQISHNTWIYQTNSAYKFLRAWDIFKLASFEIKNRNIFQADVIICEGQFTTVFAGYLLSKKFKRPLYVFLSGKSEKNFFAPVGLKNFLLSKIIWFILIKADCIKVDNFEVKEKLRKKLALKNHTIQVIKPFLDTDLLLASAKTSDSEERMENNFIKRKFPDFKFTAVAFVDDIEQVKLALNILKKINKHFPPISLVLLLSYNLKSSYVNFFIKKRLKFFVRVENVGEDLCEYLVSANTFFGISEGEKYEGVLSKACAVGATIIALDSSVSKTLIEDNTTGFICPLSDKQKTIDYFAAKTLFLMENPSIGSGFKMNIAISFKEQFNNTKEEYLNKLKLSWKECLEKYKKSHLKFYRY
ncbi:MAG: hypothetical protein US45_C0043G0010 [Candidatus Nomurabacteria bacterium GW2011_GWA1_37_20]|uniref:Glycosyl transferase family 1 domain-containing protein n=1 Tax=Candidatus Nomurabacteria bacterium GW2011_GWA1_37_20 TaxID=1618729 RepID=A0A0G0GN53_9BACT|nr:MAG: hypothetical protein US33_C0040G0011 [Parcubacteria group bacterium GW2011_GWC1_36_9]KKQ26883.1 MAG: hypothetical protein US41_C0029G0011 [Parcubacteria group bacterium GW2011_GWB1_37_13]KKQ31457.1 MAG: hypothetical protein US45_C0043G0010 [Candidatus Nomurabacteria bacterium GW2011_GWA1_37_20]